MKRPLRPLGWAVALAVMSFTWIDVLHTQVVATLDAGAAGRMAWGLAITTFAIRIGTHVVETTWYVLVGRAFGRPVRFAPLLAAIFGLSLLDALALGLAPGPGTESLHPALAILVGPRAVAGALAGPPGLRVALGSVGLLTLARVAGTAWAAAREGLGARLSLAATCGAWIAGRLASWWTTDLVRGVSPLP